MKEVQKILLAVLCGLLCTVISCGGSSGSNTNGGEKNGGENGEDKNPVPFVGEMAVFDDSPSPDFGDSTIEMTITEEDGMTYYNFTGDVTTTFQYGFVGWEFKPDEATLELLKKASAISFMTKGDGKMHSIKYRLSSITDHAHYERQFRANAEPAMVKINITQFSQPTTWGIPRPMNKNLAEDISWQTYESWRPDLFDITIWDVQIHP